MGALFSKTASVEPGTCDPRKLAAAADVEEKRFWLDEDYVFRLLQHRVEGGGFVCPLCGELMASAAVLLRHLSVEVVDDNVTRNHQLRGVSKVMRRYLSGESEYAIVTLGKTVVRDTLKGQESKPVCPFMEIEPFGDVLRLGGKRDDNLLCPHCNKKYPRDLLFLHLVRAYGAGIEDSEDRLLKELEHSCDRGAAFVRNVLLSFIRYANSRIQVLQLTGDFGVFLKRTDDGKEVRLEAWDAMVRRRTFRLYAQLSIKSLMRQQRLAAIDAPMSSSPDVDDSSSWGSKSSDDKSGSATHHEPRAPKEVGPGQVLLSSDDEKVWTTVDTQTIVDLRRSHIAPEVVSLWLIKQGRSPSEKHLCPHCCRMYSNRANMVAHFVNVFGDKVEALSASQHVAVSTLLDRDRAWFMCVDRQNQTVQVLLPKERYDERATNRIASSSSASEESEQQDLR